MTTETTETKPKVETKAETKAESKEPANSEKKFRGYRESETFKPNIFDQVGSAITNGFGTHFSNYSGIAPVFADAYKNSLVVAKKALDPEDPTVAASHVVLPDGATISHSDPEAAKERVLAKAGVLDESDDQAWESPAKDEASPVEA